MAAATSKDLLSVFDGCPLHARYWTAFALLSAVGVVDFFDFFSVGFLVAVIGPQWHLTYGESAAILLGGGVGAIAGSLVGGALGDVWGRKAMIVWGTFICAIGAAAIALIPNGAWLLFAVLRFFVGFGLGASFAPATTAVVEITPTRHRTVVASLFVISASLGVFIASSTAALLLNAIGWRGIAALGIVPALIGFGVILFVPESVRWLVAKGRHAEAQAAVAKLLHLPPAEVPLPTVQPVVQPRASFAELYTRPSLFWLVVLIWGGAATAGYGMLLWGPTIVAQLMSISVKQAAHFFVYVTFAGIVGKFLFSFAAPLLGRRRLGQIHGFGMFVALFCAGYFHSALVGGVSLFVVALAATDFFNSGGFSNLAPYTPEAYGVRMGSRASGLGQALNGVGKILGPLSLAVIAGTSNVLRPAATEAAVFPAFMFFAGCGLVIALAFSFLAHETHGQPVAQDAGTPATAARIATAPRAGAG
jgi:MFS transporter, putative metabolite:H+ symporter